MSGNYPPLLDLESEDEYFEQFKKTYCKAPVKAFDGIEVRFRQSCFKHAFYESVKGGKDNQFSLKRARRLHWIKAALQDSNSEIYLGYNKQKKKYDYKRRVSVVMGNYVVVISIQQQGKAEFITAFVADTPPRPGRPSTIQQIRKGPVWKQKNR